MARVKLREQDEYEFTYRLKAEVTTLNAGGHVGYDSVLNMTWIARSNVLNDLGGFTDTNLGDAQTGMIMTDLTVNYRGEIHRFDEVEVGTHFGEIEKHTLRAFNRVVARGQVVALVECGFIAFDYKSRTRASLPETFLSALARYKDAIAKR